MLNSDLLITSAYYCALFLLTFVVYILIFEENPNKDRYKSPDWYYLFKRIIATPTISKLKKKLKKAQSGHNADVQEHPKKISSEKKTDSQVVYGVDQEGNSFFLKIILHAHRTAEVTLCLRLSNSGTYTLPNEPQILLCSTQGRLWSAGGLTLNILEPYCRIRITYNGFLKRNGGDVGHVKLNFVWNSADKPFHFPQDVPNALLSDALAKERWRDGDWIELMGDEKGYEQYGALRGTISGALLSGTSSLYLQSFRKRYWGTGEYSTLHRDFSIFVVAENGTLFHIGAKSFKKGCARLKYGTYLDSSGKIVAVQQHDINLEYVGEYVVPNVISFHFRASGKTYKCVATLMPRCAFTTTSDDVKGWVLKTVPCRVIVNSGKGSGFSNFWYAQNGTGRDLPDILLTEPKLDGSVTDFVTPFTRRECEVQSLAGQKGKLLALASSMSSDNFKVPDGFVVLTTALKHQLATNEKLKKAVIDLENVCWGRTEGDLGVSCAQTVDLFLSEPMNESVAASVLDQIDLMAAENTHTWTVSTSGVLEECDDLAFGGQSKTLLGLRKADVVQAVSSCWSSMFTYQSVLFRRQSGLAINCGAAVIIQHVLPSDAFGTLFSCHPSTSDPSRIVIEVTTSDPDGIILNRSWRGDLSIDRKEVAGKTLTDEQALTLGQAAIELEYAFGHYCEIEWGYCGATLYLLKLCLITKLNHWTDDELLHEFDTPIMATKSLTTIASVSELMPGALTPLSNSIMTSIASDHIYKPFGKKIIVSSHYHAVMDVKNNFLSGLDGGDFDQTAPKRWLHFKYVKMLTNVVRVLADTFKINQSMQTSHHLCGKKIECGGPEKKSARTILGQIKLAVENLRKLGECHSFVAHNSVVQMLVLMTLTAENTDSAEYFSKLSLLLPLNSSLEISKHMNSVSRIIHDAGAHREFIRVNPADGMAWLRFNCPNARDEIELFLKNYGDRGIREFELGGKTWASDLIGLIETLQFYCKLNKNKLIRFDSSSNIAKTRPKNRVISKIVKFLTQKCKKSIIRKEQTKSGFIKTIDKIRFALQVLSEQMVSEGMIPDPSLVYYFSWYELNRLVCEHDHAATPRATRRQRLYPFWDKITLPTVMHGVPKSVEKGDILEVNSPKYISGRAVSHGDVHGRACVVRNVEDIKQLQAGDVLIASSVNISWSPYFAMVAGLVTESSGILSYGAVIAKDYGFPCLEDVQNATLVFNTGDYVYISGKKSSVELYGGGKHH